MPRDRETPYWLVDGTEICSLCTFSHVLEMEYRCVGCDRGVCEQCAIVVRETWEVFCSECHALDRVGD